MLTLFSLKTLFLFLQISRFQSFLVAFKPQVLILLFRQNALGFVNVSTIIKQSQKYYQRKYAAKRSFDNSVLTSDLHKVLDLQLMFLIGKQKVM